VSRIFLFFYSSLLLVSCVSAPPTHFDAISVSQSPAGHVILKENVMGRDCHGFIATYGSYEIAAQRAIESVEGAEFLVNASFYRKEMPIARICVFVEGDAAKYE